MKVKSFIHWIILVLIVPAANAAGQSSNTQYDSLTTRFERLLLARKYDQLEGVLDEFEAAGLAAGNHELKFLRGLCSVENKKWKQAKVSLQKYLSSGDSTYRTEARSLLATVPGNNSNEITNSIGMKLVRMPKGSFTMGSKYSYSSVQNLFNEVNVSGPDSFADEHPRHRVNITNDFYVGKFEVTIAEYEKFVNETGYRTDAQRNGGSVGGFDPNSGQKTPNSKWVEANWRRGSKSEPVSFVSWRDANEFVVWLGKKEGKKYRLPTEAEWEYFARAGTSTLFSTGDSVETLAGYANVPDLTMKRSSQELSYAVIQSFDGHSGKAPVGSFKPNAFGLHDVHGNVFEWCYDGYAPNAYSLHKSTNPYIKVNTEFRVIRGGCYM